MTVRIILYTTMTVLTYRHIRLGKITLIHIPNYNSLYIPIDNIAVHTMFIIKPIIQSIQSYTKIFCDF